MGNSHVSGTRVGPPGSLRASLQGELSKDRGGGQGLLLCPQLGVIARGEALQRLTGIGVSAGGIAWGANFPASFQQRNKKRAPHMIVGALLLRCLQE